ncbi:MAG TPA: PAS domain S-box protein, partial [Saprospiraceae bacterium]|nr:PAS domain S-box protein [Saprospiraceae bacterium]
TRRKFELEWASTYGKGLARLKEQQHDIYIIDYLLGAKNGIDLIREAMHAGCTLPMILLTGINNEAVDETAAQLGAFDYLIKDSLNEERLERSIRYAMAQAASAKALRESERQYRTIFEQSRDMIFLADLDGQLTSASSAAAELTGYEPEELIGLSFSSLLADAEDVQTISAYLSTGRNISNQEVDIVEKDGSLRTCSISLSLYNNHQGTPYYQGVLHDLTAEIREQRALLMTDKMEATGRLMRTLAHEVRNPLTNIHLALEGIAITDLDTDSEIHDYVDIIRRNSNRISDLITQLLNSSRPAELKASPHSLSEVLKETTAETRDRIALRKISLEESYDPQSDLVMLDVAKVKIAFTNIIINALEAMDEGEGRLEVGTWVKPDKVIAYIRDNGAGIPPENLTRLFEPYFTSKSTGMGLGLAATLNILNSHGSTVDVESKVGEGTVFWLTFHAVK